MIKVPWCAACTAAMAAYDTAYQHALALTGEYLRVQAQGARFRRVVTEAQCRAQNAWERLRNSLEQQANVAWAEVTRLEDGDVTDCTCL